MAGTAAASARSASACPSGVVVVFMGQDGAIREEPLSRCWNEPFERAAPVRGFPSYRGQRSWPGLWWFSGTGEHVGYGSWLERDTLMAMDADPGIVAVSARPIRLHWTDEQSGQAATHVPDFFARHTDGTGTVIDVHPDQRVRDHDTAAATTISGICAQVGWSYRHIGGLAPVHAANLTNSHPVAARRPRSGVRCLGDHRRLAEDYKHPLTLGSARLTLAPCPARTPSEGFSR